MEIDRSWFEAHLRCGQVTRSRAEPGPGHSLGTATAPDAADGGPDKTHGPGALARATVDDGM